MNSIPKSRRGPVEPGPPQLTGRATLAVTVGNMLEFYDFVTYIFLPSRSATRSFPPTAPLPA